MWLRRTRGRGSRRQGGAALVAELAGRLGATGRARLREARATRRAEARAIGIRRSAGLTRRHGYPPESRLSTRVRPNPARVDRLPKFCPPGASPPGKRRIAIAPCFTLSLSFGARNSFSTIRGGGRTMAQRVQVLLVCDMHDGESAAEETVSFSMDGSAYEIDLCRQHANNLREAFAPFVGAGRRATARSGGRRRRGSGSHGRAGEIRDWARSQGLTVPARGRIPADLAAKYDAAH